MKKILTLLLLLTLVISACSNNDTKDESEALAQVNDKLEQGEDSYTFSLTDNTSAQYELNTTYKFDSDAQSYDVTITEHDTTNDLTYTTTYTTDIADDKISNYKVTDNDGKDITKANPLKDVKGISVFTASQINTSYTDISKDIQDVINQELEGENTTSDDEKYYVEVKDGDATYKYEINKDGSGYKFTPTDNYYYTLTFE